MFDCGRSPLPSSYTRGGAWDAKDVERGNSLITFACRQRYDVPAKSACSLQYFLTLLSAAKSSGGVITFPNETLLNWTPEASGVHVNATKKNCMFIATEEQLNEYAKNVRGVGL